MWHEKTFATAGDTCSTEERLATFSIELAACKEKAEGYGIANYIFWQSATERPAGTPLCHVYKSCEVTRTSSLPGTNYEFVTEGMFGIIDCLIDVFFLNLKNPKFSLTKCTIYL